VNISQRGIDLIKEFEGCRLKAYKCPAGVWTIGYGATGSGIVEGFVWSQEKADAALAKHLAEFSSAVTSLVTVPVTQSQFDALVSFAYNVGANALRKSTLLRLLNSGDYSGAAKQFGRWINKGTSFESGLRRRREAERQLFTGA